MRIFKKYELLLMDRDWFCVPQSCEITKLHTNISHLFILLNNVGFVMTSPQALGPSGTSVTLYLPLAHFISSTAMEGSDFKSLLHSGIYQGQHCLHRPAEAECCVPGIVLNSWWGLCYVGSFAD